LELVSTDDYNLTNKYCTLQDLESVSYEKAMIKIEYLMEKLENDFSRDEYLIIGVCNGYGSLRPGQNDGRGVEYAKELDKKCDAFFGTGNNVDFYLNKVEGRKQYNLPPKAILLGSDSHSFLDFNNKLGEQFTWIKADPTFKGLRQILFEPEARVRIMGKNPLEDFPKPYFSSIKINETKIFNNSAVKFTDNEISLNPDLVTIIGGRGTGKSLLLDSIAKTFDKNDDERVKALNIDSDKFLITYRKDDNDELEFNINKEDNYLDYLHIHQGDVKKITDPKNPTKLDEEIKKLLGIQYDTLEVESENIEKIIDELFEINDFLNKKNDNDEAINSEEYLDKEINKKETLIKNITTKETKELIKKYTNNKKTISDKENFINKLNRLKENLDIFLETANKEIEEINTNLIDDKKIPAIDLQQQMTKINKLLEDEMIDKNQLEEKNNEIREDFIRKDIKGDITSLLEQVGNYQKEIETLKKQKLEITKKKKSFESKINSLKEIIERQKISKEKYKNQVLDKWANIKKGKEGWSDEQKELLNELLKDINIDFQEIYDSNELVKSIKDFLNLKKFQETTDKKSNERILETFNLNEKDGVINLIKGEKQIDYNGKKKDLYELLSSELFAKRGAKEFIKYLLIENKNFWKIISVPKYKNKTIDNLSVGMKGTMYVCLKLATDPFLKPFIFDQPEDDLDNDFIMNELVPLFRKIKKYRQVIIVTHNANLVVNADAEQVIIAENNDENISYKSGSIENLDIREKIYQILEGGKTAFEKREKKYGFKIS
jgi:hypothetical protein